MTPPARDGAVAYAAPATAAATAPPLRRPRPVRETVPAPARRRPAPPRRRSVATPGSSRAANAILDHRLLDRLIRGRLWIGFVAFALIGIVATQLAQLPLNNNIGRTLTSEQTLTRENATLRLQVSELSSADRIEALASGLGMVATAPGAIRFLDAGHAPSTSAVEAALAKPVDQSAPSTGSATTSTSSDGSTASDSSASTGTSTASGG